MMTPCHQRPSDGALLLPPCRRQLNAKVLILTPHQQCLTDKASLMGCLATNMRRFGTKGDGGRNAPPQERMARRKDARRRGRALDGRRVGNSRIDDGAMVLT